MALRDMVSYPEFRTSGAGHEPFPGDRIAVSGIFVLMRTTLASFFLSSGLGTVQGALASALARSSQRYGTYRRRSARRPLPLASPYRRAEFAEGHFYLVETVVFLFRSDRFLW